MNGTNTTIKDDNSDYDDSTSWDNKNKNQKVWTTEWTIMNMQTNKLLSTQLQSSQEG